MFRYGILNVVEVHPQVGIDYVKANFITLYPDRDAVENFKEITLNRIIAQLGFDSWELIFKENDAWYFKKVI